MTILCIYLGWNVERARRQRDVADVIRRSGGIVLYEWEINQKTGAANPKARCPVPERVCKFFGDDFFFKVAGVSCSTVGDADLAFLDTLDHEAITFLWLGNSDVTDSGIASLPALPNLKCLCLNGTRITDDSLTCLRRYPKLMFLRLDDTSITDVGLRSLYHLTHLRSVCLHGTNKVVKGHIELRERFPNCTVNR